MDEPGDVGAFHRRHPRSVPGSQRFGGGSSMETEEVRNHREKACQERNQMVMKKE